MDKANCYLFFCIAPTVSRSIFLPVGKNYTTKKGQLRCPFNKYLQSAGPSDPASRYFLKTKEKNPALPPQRGTARGGPTAQRQNPHNKKAPLKRQPLQFFTSWQKLHNKQGPQHHLHLLSCPLAAPVFYRLAKNYTTKKRPSTGSRSSFYRLAKTIQQKRGSRSSFLPVGKNYTTKKRPPNVKGLL